MFSLFVFVCVYFFFFFKQKTAYELRISDWSSDVCPSDLSRELRRNGRVPAVVYGGKEDPLMIHVEEKLLMKQLMTGIFMNSVVMIEVGGKTIRTLPKDVAFHPVKDRPIHADFLRVSKDTKVQVGVPEIGRASCRERVCQYVEISVVAGSVKKKKNKN